jgi:hypothetical protein
MTCRRSTNGAQSATTRVMQPTSMMPARAVVTRAIPQTVDPEAAVCPRDRGAHARLWRASVPRRRDPHEHRHRGAGKRLRPAVQRSRFGMTGEFGVVVECTMCHNVDIVLPMQAMRDLPSGTPRHSFDVWNSACQQGGCHPTFHDDTIEAHWNTDADGIEVRPCHGGSGAASGGGPGATPCQPDSCLNCHSGFSAGDTTPPGSGPSAAVHHLDRCGGPGDGRVRRNRDRGDIDILVLRQGLPQGPGRHDHRVRPVAALQISCMACHMPVNADPITFLLHKAEALGELYLTATNKFDLPLNPGLAPRARPEAHGFGPVHAVSQPREPQRHAQSRHHHRPRGPRRGEIHCTVCHNRVAHVEDFELTLTDPNTGEPNQPHEDFMLMTACFRCHTLTGESVSGIVAPGECEACHTPGLQPHARQPQ